MKKKLIGVAIIAAIAVAAGWNFNQSKNEVAMSDLALANVDALANGEGSGSCKWRTGHSSSTGWIAICDEYGVGYGCECGTWKSY